MCADHATYILAVMHRPFWLRALVAVWGLWFTTAVVEPAGLFACVKHNGLAAVGQQVASSAPSASGSGHEHHGVTADRHTAHSTDAAVPDGESAPESHDCCTCIGHCCATVPVTAPRPTVIVDAEIASETSPQPRAPEPFSPGRVAYVLPYANGPPAIALS